MDLESIAMVGLRGSLTELQEAESHEESVEHCQTLFFSRSDSLLILRSNSLK